MTKTKQNSKPCLIGQFANQRLETSRVKLNYGTNKMEIVKDAKIPFENGTVSLVFSTFCFTA